MLKTIVRKNLILRLAVPRFFVQGDEVIISALVHNYLATPRRRASRWISKASTCSTAPRKTSTFRSRGEVRVDWRVRAQQVRSATITGKALTDEESDALELELPVNIPGVKLSAARGGSLAAGAAAAFDLTFPAKVQPGSRSLAIRISPSIAGSLFGALEYLTSFPYGCVEQTMSSFLPNIVVTQAVHDLGLKVRSGPGRLAGEDPRRSRPPVQLPARRRRLGLVGDRREPSVHDRLRGRGPGAGAGRRACK